MMGILREKFIGWLIVTFMRPGAAHVLEIAIARSEMDLITQQSYLEMAQTNVAMIQKRLKRLRAQRDQLYDGQELGDAAQDGKRSPNLVVRQLPSRRASRRLLRAGSSPSLPGDMD